ncbi:tRNA synthetases class I-domain-containing protein, partial [Piptocephalis cylindrospora]
KPVLQSLQNAYTPNAFESSWYRWWEEEGYFSPTSSVQREGNKAFRMIVPPPNVTGALHIGHALTFSIQDAQVRWRRMLGEGPVTWVPGTDHAGIGTQSVVERWLEREGRPGRRELGREAFEGEVNRWKEMYGETINEQLRRLGASLSWNDQFFTLDCHRSFAVTEAFVQLYERGLIYRTTRMVNWCPALETAISDMEMEWKEIKGRTDMTFPGRDSPVTMGVLYHIAYPLSNGGGDMKELVVATTRPETLLADIALAVHPQDQRYKSIIGGNVKHPITGKNLPIIADDVLVDPEFGTGVVKITPSHDEGDYNCAQRHTYTLGTKYPEGFDGKGRVISDVPNFHGMDRFEAREHIIQQLWDKGYVREVNESHTMRVSVCSRSGDLIEPTLCPQWYVSTKGMAEKALESVEKGSLEVHPNKYAAEWRRWLGATQDWCISRQLWWGHRIPAYRVIVPSGETKGPLGALRNEWFIAHDQEKAQAKVRLWLQNHGIPKEKMDNLHLEQDPDVLDTWFSSALLPLSASQWPAKAPIPLEQGCPTSMLETGADIIFFWVARMVMLCTELSPSGSLPFPKVYLHPMVRDSQGRKMSKSLGNVIDPIQVMDGATLEELVSKVKAGNTSQHETERSIKDLHKEYPDGMKANGADALRMALISYTQQTRQINLDGQAVVGATHFGNKLWNLASYTIGRAQGREKEEGKSNILPHSPNVLSLLELGPMDRYILSRTAETVERVNGAFLEMRLHEVTTALRRLVVDEICDVYVEYTKPILYCKDPEDQVRIRVRDVTMQVLGVCLEAAVRLLHPIMPFITEVSVPEIGMQKHFNSFLIIYA